MEMVVMFVMSISMELLRAFLLGAGATLGAAAILSLPAVKTKFGK